MTFDPDLYLARLGLAAPPRPDAAGLSALIGAQLAAIPFENCGPLLGEVPDLAPAVLWDRLVTQGRGGYCFQLNGLLSAALAAFGFAATPVMARVQLGRPEIGARSHLAFLVHIDGQDWLADAGFGGPGADRALLLDDPAVTEGRGGAWRARRDGDLVQFEKAMPEGWFPLYAFDPMPVAPADLEAANFVCARAPFSPFPAHLMVGRLTPTGRAGLFDRRLTTPEGPRDLTDAADLARTLTETFALPTDSATAAALWARLPTD